MTMRLLQKREIDRAKALDKRREIDEGVKLAEKVDSLRELKAKEDEGLQKWRTETLKGIQAEIAVLAEAKNALDREVTEKRGELLSLSAPLDKAWKFYVTSERAEIERLKAISAQELLTYQNKVLENDSIAEDLKAEANRNHLDKQENLVVRMETKRNLDESLKLVEDARSKARKISLEAERIEKSALKRDENTKRREGDVAIKEAALKRKEDEVETREMEALAKELLYYSPVKASK